MAMKVLCRILRQNQGEEPRWETHRTEVPRGTTVLNLLQRIAEGDPGLAYTPHHCKMGICGACGMVINGRRRLACRTLVGSPEIRLEPVPGAPLIQDLLVDLLSRRRKP